MEKLKLSNLRDPRKVLYLLLFIGALVFGGINIPSRFSVTITPSLKHRVFFLKNTSNGSEIKKDNYVLFNMSTSYINNGKRFNAIKEVSCVSREYLTVKDKNYFCDEQFIGHAKDISLRGEPVNNFLFDGHIPEGMIFVTGGHKDSYDSKYFGFLRRKDVKAIAYPIF